MELLKEILTKIIEKEETNIIFPNLKINAKDTLTIFGYPNIRTLCKYMI